MQTSDQRQTSLSLTACPINRRTLQSNRQHSNSSERVEGQGSSGRIIIPERNENVCVDPSNKVPQFPKAAVAIQTKPPYYSCENSVRMLAHKPPMFCRAIGNTQTAQKELEDKAAVADQALANSQSDVETLQVEFNEASGLVQQKERELREARQAADQKAKQLDVARYEQVSSSLLANVSHFQLRPSR